MKKAVKLEIYGTVQGVFFRSFVKENADRLELKGYVRNREDGSVEVRLEGEGEKVKIMVELCKKGPAHSEIKKVNIFEENFQGLEDFKVLRM